MSKYKISMPVAGDRVSSLLDVLGEVAGADAVTAFEAGPGDWRLEAYYGDMPDMAGFAEMMATLGVPQGAGIAVEEIAAENWVAKVQSRLAPVTAGRFLVHGSHDRDNPSVRARGRRALLIDAGEAFGTAHHATTRGCLMALDALIKRRSFDRILDIGTGAGTLAIAAATCARRAKIWGSDIDPIAVWVAQGNARLNGAGAGCTGRIRFVTAAGLDHPGLRRQQADLVFANILAGPLIKLAPRIAGAVAKGGVLVLSGLLSVQADAVLASYQAHGLIRERRRDFDGWSTLVLRRAGRR